MFFPRLYWLILCVGIFLVSTGVPQPCSAFKVIRDNTDSHNGTRLLVVPYAFSSEATGLGYGIGASYSGWPQEQAIVGGTVWRTSDKTDAVYLNLTDFQLPFANRVFMTLHGFEGSYDNMVSYASGTGDGKRPAENDSGRNSYYQGHGWDQWGEAVFTYVLPMGPFGDEPIHTYVTNRGLLADGSLYQGEYNPLTSGRSYVKAKPFYRKRWFQKNTPSARDVETAGMQLAWEYDNTDFSYDPSVGSKTIARIWQGLNTGSTDAWTAVEFDFSKFWALDESDWFKKKVVGFNFWTVDTPSWRNHSDGSVSGDSPYYMGASLGGYARQRGFPFYRFHDKSAINYSLEYRAMPRWSPLDSFPWFKWWEVVPFVEAGRVANYWSPVKMHSRMKFTGGVGVRAMVLNSVLRCDAAVSKEGMNVWAMINQTF